MRGVHLQSALETHLTKVNWKFKSQKSVENCTEEVSQQHNCTTLLLAQLEQASDLDESFAIAKTGSLFKNTLESLFLACTLKQK